MLIIFFDFIVNSFHKVKQSWNDCMKVFEGSEYNDAPVHSALVILNFFTKNDMMVLPESPYSPDLGPVDFFILQTQVARQLTKMLSAGGNTWGG